MHSVEIQRLLLIALVLTATGELNARPAANRARLQVRVVPDQAVPFVTSRVHQVGNIRLNVTNWGFVGSQYGGERDPCLNRPAPSFEYPARSGLEYLYYSALWIGAVKGRDTLVSVGTDGWLNVQEFFPRPWPEGQIVERTNRDVLQAPRNSTCPDSYFNPDAISEQDLVAVYYDTLLDPTFVVLDDYDGRQHIPLELEVTQSSYSWSMDYARDFIIINYDIRNIGNDTLRRMYVGHFVDPDVGHTSESNVYNDDLTGFIRDAPAGPYQAPEAPLNMVWSVDNDGDPRDDAFYWGSPTSVLGARILHNPWPVGDLAFNWWVSNSNTLWDWGPNRRDTPVYYVAGNLGTPNGDRAKYWMMANGEIDYDQIEGAIDHTADGWLPPVSNPVLARDIADGFDVRYLLSAGPLELSPDSNVRLTLALVAAPDFHTDPMNFQSYFDPGHPDRYLSRVDLEPLYRTARWAEWVYDTPGLDTDGDGNAGPYYLNGDDTIFVAGDGVPDYRMPPPPPVPPLRFSGRRGSVVIRWNGEFVETARDLFSRRVDFEGYRVYLSRTGMVDDFAMIAQRDRIDYLRFWWDASPQVWRVTGDPLTPESLATLYASLEDSLGYLFHPDSFPGPSLERALCLITPDTINPTDPDTNYFYFAPFDANLRVDDTALYRADSAGVHVAKAIRKPFPYAGPDDIAYREGGEPFRPFYEYEFVIDGLYLAEPLYLAITAFDFGDPAAGVSSQEASAASYAEYVLPGVLAATEQNDRSKPGLYPNPYHLIDDYRGAGWEDPPWVEPDPERARRITFYHLPAVCTITIWTLDGDRVQTLKHREYPGSPQETEHVWNLINRNGDRIVHGLYIWTVESEYGTDMGKLAIIR